nr:SelB C-terminal domain-containing protein [Fodinicola feengrottensis]
MSSGRPAAASELTLRQHGFRLAAELTRAGLPLAGEPISHWRADPARLAELVPPGTHRGIGLAGRKSAVRRHRGGHFAAAAGRTGPGDPHRAAPASRPASRRGCRTTGGRNHSAAASGRSRTSGPRRAGGQPVFFGARRAKTGRAWPGQRRTRGRQPGRLPAAAAGRRRTAAGRTAHRGPRSRGPATAVRSQRSPPSALGTTRRVALPLLEFLDRLRITERLPDDRRRLREVDLDDSTIHA